MSAAADFWVKSLPDVFPGAYMPLMFSGLIEVEPKSGAHLFFWYIQAKYQVSERPKTVIWLNGGPGCSSMDGALLEMGPFRPNSDGYLHENSGAWTDYVNMIFVDQPLGVGYSDPQKKIFAHSLDEAAQHMNGFLEEYARIFPEITASDVYIGGESYAGQYIPYIWRSLHDNNSSIMLQGAIMANPWLDPAHQYLSYAPFAKAHGLVDPSMYDELDQVHERCLNSLASSSLVTPRDEMCDGLYDYIATSYREKTSPHHNCFNVYKYTEESPYPLCGLEWPPEVAPMKQYLTRADVRTALLHTSSQELLWEECSIFVGESLNVAHTAASITIMPEMLENIPVLVMIGDLDFICNADGLEATFQNLGYTAYAVENTNLTLAEEYVGSIRTDRNLSVAHIANGSHMVPVDMQLETRMILNGFTGVTQGYDSLGPAHIPSKPLHTPTVPISPPSSSLPASQQEQIDEAMRRAYRHAGIVALLVVISFGTGLLVVWMRSNSNFSFMGFWKAMLHTGLPKRNENYIQLQSLRTRPEAIPEEDEEGVEEDFRV